MPRAKGRKKGRRAADSRQASDEEYDTGDNASVISNASTDAHSITGPIEVGDEVDEISAQEEFEDKLKDVIDGLTQKSVKGRTDMLLALRTAFTKKYAYEFVFDRKVTVLDSLEKCLKKGKGDEQAQAAICCVLLVLQLGAGPDTEQMYIELRPLLTTIMADKTAASKARTACAEALGILTFLASGDIGHAIEVMKTLENVFRASYLKGDRSVPSHSPDISTLHNAALISWALLLSIVPDSAVQDFIDSHLLKLPQLLESADVELRITAGETIALMYELARDMDPQFDGDDIDSLCETLKELATDSNKYRAKKDRRQQRSSFRDILRAVEEGDAPSYSVRFGMEYISVNSWTRKRQYDSLCHVLTIGMNIHLSENELVRDIFGLGAPIPVGMQPLKKPSRNERHMFNAAAFKARTKARSKVRDKRAVAVHMSHS